MMANPKPITIDIELKVLGRVLYAVCPKPGAEEELTAFTRSEEVVAAAQNFARKLDILWQERTAGKVLGSTKSDAPNIDLSDELVLHAPSARVSAVAQLNESVAQMPEPRRSGKPLMPTMLAQQYAVPLGTTNDGAMKPKSADAIGVKKQDPTSKQTSNAGPVFSLPNAKAGQAYVGVIKIPAHEGPAFKFRNVRIPEGVGLSFDEDAGALTGTPALDGEHQITWEWSVQGEKWLAGACTLLVNPDPQSLWKVREPPADAPYQKPHLAGHTLDCGSFRITAGSRRGRSHEHSGGFRDDEFWIAHNASSEWSVMIVCDGAGSAKNSRWGSKLACDIGGQHLFKELTAGSGQRISALLDTWETDTSKSAVKVEFRNMFYEMARQSVQAIEAEAATQGATPRDYSTTMLAVAVRKRGDDTFLASFWMGDGAIAVYGPKGKVRLMGVPDGGDFVGQTRFLDMSAVSDPNFGKRVSVGRYSGVLGVLAMTDGISDPRFETDSAMSDAKRWDELWEAIRPSLAAEVPHDALVSWMDFLTAGHHDDRTLAVLW